MRGVDTVPDKFEKAARYNIMLDHTYAEPQEKESSWPKSKNVIYRDVNKYRDSFSQVERANEGERL